MKILVKDLQPGDVLTAVNKIVDRVEFTHDGGAVHLTMIDAAGVTTYGVYRSNVEVLVIRQDPA